MTAKSSLAVAAGVDRGGVSPLTPPAGVGTLGYNRARIPLKIAPVQ